MGIQETVLAQTVAWNEHRKAFRSGVAPQHKHWQLDKIDACGSVQNAIETGLGQQAPAPARFIPNPRAS